MTDSESHPLFCGQGTLYGPLRKGVKERNEMQGLLLGKGDSDYNGCDGKSLAFSFTGRASHNIYRTNN